MVYDTMREYAQFRDVTVQRLDKNAVRLTTVTVKIL